MKIHSKRSIFYVIFIFLLLLFILYQFEYQAICQKRVYTDMQDNIDAIQSSNIVVISKTYNDAGSAGYSVGASGVIIQKDDQGYYAITACHVTDKQNTDFLIRTVNDPSYIEYKHTHPEMSVSTSYEYYDQLAIASVVYEDKAADVAILYFQSSQDLTTATISSTNPAKGDRIVSIGTYADQNQFFIDTYGKVESNKMFSFHTDDGQEDAAVMKSNAFVAEGFSGAGVFNENMELVGMDIGGQTNIFRRFMHGVFVPCEIIQECMEESNIF